MLFLRCSVQSVCKLAHNEVDFSLSTAACIAVAAFEKEHEVVALAVDVVEIIRTEFFPVIMDLVSKLLPSCTQNILMHSLITSG